MTTSPQPNVRLITHDEPPFTEAGYYLKKRGLYYRPRAAGYTQRQMVAGVFSYEYAWAEQEATKLEKDPMDRVAIELARYAIQPSTPTPDPAVEAGHGHHLWPDDPKTATELLAYLAEQFPATIGHMPIARYLAHADAELTTLRAEVARLTEESKRLNVYEKEEWDVPALNELYFDGGSHLIDFIITYMLEEASRQLGGHGWEAYESDGGLDDGIDYEICTMLRKAGVMDDEDNVPTHQKLMAQLATATQANVRAQEQVRGLREALDGKTGVIEALDRALDGTTKTEQLERYTRGFIHASRAIAVRNLHAALAKAEQERDEAKKKLFLEEENRNQLAVLGYQLAAAQDHIRVLRESLTDMVDMSETLIKNIADYAKDPRILKQTNPRMTLAKDVLSQTAPTPLTL